MQKLQCTVTKNFQYVTDERWAQLIKRYGSEDNLRANYVSRTGKIILETGGKIPQTPKDRVRCIVTGELLLISPKRMEKLAAQVGSVEKVRETYVSRVAQRLRKTLKAAHSDWTDVQIDDHIRDLAQNHKLPNAALPKGEGKRLKELAKAAKEAAKKAAASAAQNAAQPAEQPANVGV